MLADTGQIALLGVGCLAVSWLEHFRTPAWRPYRALMFVGLGLSGVMPILYMLATEFTYAELDERMGLNWVILQGALYIFGAFLYAVRLLLFLFPSTHPLTHTRLDGPNAGGLVPLTSGAAPTKSSTSSSSWPPPPISTA